MGCITLQLSSIKWYSTVSQGVTSSFPTAGWSNHNCPVCPPFLQCNFMSVLIFRHTHIAGLFASRWNLWYLDLSSVYGHAKNMENHDEESGFGATQFWVIPIIQIGKILGTSSPDVTDAQGETRRCVVAGYGSLAGRFRGDQLTPLKDGGGSKLTAEILQLGDGWSTQMCLIETCWWFVWWTWPFLVGSCYAGCCLISLEGPPIPKWKTIRFGYKNTLSWGKKSAHQAEQ